MKIAPAWSAPQGYRLPRLRRLDAPAGLIQGGFPGVDDAEGRAGLQRSI
ncbi:hypothetical protein MRQ36_01285 [Micromonospora sp. R77]|nr:hypothetical protein [Micromonospora sp. R77]MCI4061278.1 hypothetical protein [Micromonospora sp. R77]